MPFFVACHAAAPTTPVSAPLGTQIGLLLRDKESGGAALDVFDLATSAHKRTRLSGAPVAASWAGGGAGHFLALTDLRLVAWTGLGDRAERTFSLSGFRPTGVAGGGDAALVISSDVSSAARLALWRPDGAAVTRIDAFTQGDAVGACACDLGGERWLAVGVTSVQAGRDQLAVIGWEGRVRSLLDMLGSELRGAAGCVANPVGPEIAVVYSTSRHVLVLRLAGDVLQKVATLSLPDGLDYADRLTPVFTPGGGAVVVPARASEELALVPLDGSAPARTRAQVAGVARALGRLPGADGVLIALAGETSQVVLHFFDGSEDISLLDVGGTDDITDMVVATPEG